MAVAMDIDEKRRRIADAVYDGVVSGTHADKHLVYFAMCVYAQESVQEYERCAFLRDVLNPEKHESLV